MIEELLGRCRFPAAATSVTLAVSGGPDSLALLVLAAASRLDATAVHVDHGLRAGSASEAGVVAEAARRYGVGFRGERVVVEPGPNLEARARAARHGVLPADAMTGHTADDRAETVVLNLLRGAALEGLSAMPPDARRPLLALRRSETEAVCRSEGLQPVRDASNDDLRFRRNRVRHQLLPLMCEVAERDVVPLLCRQADLMGADADLLRQLSGSVDPGDVSALSAAPPPLAARAVRRWLRDAGATPDGQPPGLASVERVLAVARGEALAAELPGGHRVSRTAGRLRIE